jgi:hypothetical protein
MAPLRPPYTFVFTPGVPARPPAKPVRPSVVPRDVYALLLARVTERWTSFCAMRRLPSRCAA